MSVSPKKFTPAADAILMQVFHRDKGKNCALIALDEIRTKLRITFSENDINRRAIELGLTKPRKSSFFWTPEEDKFLADHAALPPVQLHKLFNAQPFVTKPRTLSAIVARIGRIGGLRELLGATGYNAQELSKHLHIGRIMIEKMTHMGILVGEKRNGRDWYYTKDAVRRFIAAHPEQIDCTKVDKYWLIGILTIDLQEAQYDTDISGTSAAVRGAGT